MGDQRIESRKHRNGSLTINLCLECQILLAFQSGHLLGIPFRIKKNYISANILSRLQSNMSMHVFVSNSRIGFDSSRCVGEPVSCKNVGNFVFLLSTTERDRVHSTPSELTPKQCVLRYANRYDNPTKKKVHSYIWANDQDSPPYSSSITRTKKMFYLLDFR